jgi:transcriptional regulator
VSKAQGRPLTDNQKRVLELREKGLTFREISAEMGWKHSESACTCFHVAVKKRKILERIANRK